MTASRNHVQQEDMVLKNLISNIEPAGKDCDHSSEDVDIGILSCGEGQYCKESAGSKLGGLCTDVAREMRSSGNPCSSYYPYKCDCSHVNKNTLTGNAVCEDIPYICYPGCSDYCLSLNVTITLSAGKPTLYHGCYNFTFPYHVVFCYTYNPSSYNCVYTVNGTKCNSCTKKSFDCSNIKNGGKGLPGVAFPIPIMKGYSLVISSKTCAPTHHPVAPHPTPHAPHPTPHLPTPHSPPHPTPHTPPHPTPHYAPHPTPHHPTPHYAPHPTPHRPTPHSPPHPTPHYPHPTPHT